MMQVRLTAGPHCVMLLLLLLLLLLLSYLMWSAEQMSCRCSCGCWQVYYRCLKMVPRARRTSLRSWERMPVVQLVRRGGVGQAVVMVLGRGLLLRRVVVGVMAVGREGRHWHVLGRVLGVQRVEALEIQLQIVARAAALAAARGVGV